MADVFRNSVRGLQDRAVTGPENYAQIPALAERGRHRVVAFLAKLNTRLEQTEYLAGNCFTIADITALVLVDFAARLKINIAEDAPHLQRWYQSVAARPSASA